MTVRTMRYEIVGWTGDPKETRARWRTIADQCREAINCMWQQWEAWHVERRSDLIAKQFAESQRAYRRGETKDKPKLELQCMPADLGKLIYRALVDRFPTLHSRIIALLTNITKQRMSGKDTEGRWNIWLAVLLNRQGRPNCTHDAPIPFGSQNSKPLKPAPDGKNYRLSVSLTRCPRDGMMATSIEDSFDLKTRGSGAVILRRVVEGEYKFCGSSVVFNSSRNKWFALIAYKMPEVQVDEPRSGIAVLRPGREHPWSLRVHGRTRWIGGRGDYVAAARRRLLTARWSRQENYRYAGSANKGHGRKRAMAGVEKLSEAWKDFTKTCNHTTTRQVINACLESRVATIVYMQPMDARRDSRFLMRAGKVEARVDSTGWDWAQIGSYLQYKAQEVGLHVEIKKVASGPRNVDVKQPKKSRRSQSASKVVGV